VSRDPARQVLDKYAHSGARPPASPSPACLMLIVSVCPDSSSGMPLKPAWSIHGSARTPNNRLSANIPPSEPQRAAGRPTGRTTGRSRTACTSLAAMIVAGRVTTEISDRLQRNRRSATQRSLGRQCELTAVSVSTLLRNRPFSLTSVELWQPPSRAETGKASLVLMQSATLALISV
jgi:hypothetical protein